MTAVRVAPVISRSMTLAATGQAFYYVFPAVHSASFCGLSGFVCQRSIVLGESWSAARAQSNQKPAEYQGMFETKAYLSGKMLSHGMRPDCIRQTSIFYLNNQDQNQAREHSSSTIQFNIPAQHCRPGRPQFSPVGRIPVRLKLSFLASFRRTHSWRRSLAKSDSVSLCKEPLWCHPLE